MTDSSHGNTTDKRMAAVIYNPIKVDLDAIKAAVAREEEAAGWNATRFVPTSEEDPGQGAARDALSAGADMVIVAGGDGTVRAVAEIVHDSNAALALVPSGTGNLLARNLKLVLEDVDQSVHTAFTGVDHPVDVGLIDLRRGNGTQTTHAFLVMAGLGLDAKMLVNTDEKLKKKVGWLAYVSAITKSLRDKSELHVKYQLDDGRVHAIRAHTIIIGNCGSLQANVQLLPDAAVDDGFFDIAVLRPEGIVSWVQVGVKVFWENGVLHRSKVGRLLATKEVDSLTYVKAKTMAMRLNKADEIELDGDSFGKITALKTQIKPGAVRIRVPQPEPAPAP